VELATNFNGEIINADAMQMYRGLPIITNKISPAEQRGIPHHLLGNVPIDERPWTVLEFRDEASRIISEIRSRGKLPVVVGGSTYYLDGLLFDDRLVRTEPTAEVDIVPYEELCARFPILSEPAEVMLEKLREVDPAMAGRWHPKDVRKIRNSLEIYFTTGRPASEIYAEQRSQKQSRWASSDSESRQSPWNVLLFWLYAKREPLVERVNKRVDKMVQNGLLSEVEEVYDWYNGKLATGETVDRTKGIVQSIGFWQFEPYLRMLKESPGNPELAKLKTAGVEETKAATRRYAAYQVKWINTKTIPSLQEERLLDRLFLLDGTDIKTWGDEVARNGVELTRRFLLGETLPSPVDLSETAKGVLALGIERGNRQSTPCNKTCDVCKTTCVTEEMWLRHIHGKRHKQRVAYAKKRTLVEFDPKRHALIKFPDVSDKAP